jgi:hypothetical protein
VVVVVAVVLVVIMVVVYTRVRVCVCARACVKVCVRARVCESVCVCAHARGRGYLSHTPNTTQCHGVPMRVDARDRTLTPATERKRDDRFDMPSQEPCSRCGHLLCVCVCVCVCAYVCVCVCVCE